MYDNLKELFQAIKDITKDNPIKVLADEWIRIIDKHNNMVHDNIVMCHRECHHIYPRRYVNKNINWYKQDITDDITMCKKEKSEF